VADVVEHPGIPTPWAAGCHITAPDGQTTRTRAEKEEFFVLELEDDRCEVRLDRLQAITPLEPGARFGRVELAGKVCAI
jgi:transcriptional antiterminator Rof (Rho-off)